MPTRRIADLIPKSATDYAIITTDLTGDITFWNSGAEKVLGWSELEVSGQPASLIYTPEDRAAGVPQMEMDGALTHGRALDERWHLRKDGIRFWASGELLVLRDGNSVEGFVKILRDRTAKRISAEGLEASRAFARVTRKLRLGSILIYNQRTPRKH